MKKQTGLKQLLATTFITSGLLLSSGANALFTIDEATKGEQLVQIAIAEQQLEHLFQAIESLQLGSELKAIFEQMYGVQSIVEDVMEYDVPPELVKKHDMLNPLEHKRLTEERQKYMEDIDTEIADLEKEIALDSNQFETLQMGMSAIAKPRSDIEATQAQFVADQSALEQDRRQLALEILRAKRVEIRDKLTAAHINSQEAAVRCIERAKSVNDC